MKRCRRCNSTRKIKSRGLCKRCWRNKSIRDLFGDADKRFKARSKRTKQRMAAWRKRGERLDDDGTKAGKVPASPTTAAPGTAEKVEVMRQRVERGEMPCHPMDAK